MSAIFNYAKSIQLGYKQNIPMHLSQSGFRSAEVRSLYLYTFVVVPNEMITDSEEYNDINSEIRGMDSGLKTMLTKIPMATKERGAWDTPDKPRVKGANQLGRTIIIDGFKHNTEKVILNGDFVQFEGGNKVYQVDGNYDSGVDGSTTVRLNTPLLKSPTDDSEVIYGEDVVFNLQMEEHSLASLTPRGINSHIATWSEFTFTEVINSDYINENNVASEDTHESVGSIGSGGGGDSSLINKILNLDAPYARFEKPDKTTFIIQVIGSTTRRNTSGTWANRATLTYT
jgi:hypothetical protein